MSGHSEDVYPALVSLVCKANSALPSRSRLAVNDNTDGVIVTAGGSPVAARGAFGSSWAKKREPKNGLPSSTTDDAIPGSRCVQPRFSSAHFVVKFRAFCSEVPRVL